MLKKIIIFSLFFLVSIFNLVAQQPVQVTGLLKKERMQPVKLFKVELGKIVEIASAQPSATGKFGFTFYPDYEGLYVLGTGELDDARNNYKFYFKGGEQLSLELLDSTYRLTGNTNSKENKVLSQWYTFSEDIATKSTFFLTANTVNVTYVDFFPAMEQLASKSSSFLNGKATGNLKFDRSMHQIIKNDLAYYATNFVFTFRTKKAAKEDFNDYYRKLNINDFAKNTNVLYRYPWGIRLLSYMVELNFKLKGTLSNRTVDGLKENINFVPNDTLKGDLVSIRMQSLTKFDDYTTYLGIFGKYILTAPQKTRDMEVMSRLAVLTPGAAAFNFSYPDKDGKMVAMTELKGKVVLVDVWATWCAPCKAEIPYLKKLEEEMKGTDVLFVSISVDEAKDKEKWLKMVKDDKLGGLQLFATGWGDLAKYYKITGIPRFMVFDKDGKIVTVNSPRPSNPELRTLLEKVLAQK
ncbi:TlpA family protein disulfide reductase [Pedobacter frigoris]|uniref:TlpA family protein disulfide reductase n=2 Tax=Pedobacter frigoris TaxID=2571272 RepID=A0A4U1CUL7_9SPHI|nr:TlpA family protein disulfide reductase [Pedobacter frigoris]